MPWQFPLDDCRYIKPETWKEMRRVVAEELRRDPSKREWVIEELDNLDRNEWEYHEEARREGLRVN